MDNWRKYLRIESLRGTVQEQKMADLLADCLPPLTLLVLSEEVVDRGFPYEEPLKKKTLFSYRLALLCLVNYDQFLIVRLLV